MNLVQPSPFGKRIVALILPCFLLSASVALSQSNPLDEVIKTHPRIGLEVGLSSAWQSGEYLTGCGDFKEGAAINGVIALAYDHPLSGDKLRFEALLGFQGRSVSSSYNSRENVLLNTNNGLVRTDVDFENQGEFNTSMFFFLPSLKYYFGKAVYAGVGASGNFVTGGTSQYTKNILSRTVLINELGLSDVYYADGESSDPYSKVYPAEERKDVNSFTADLAFYAGLEFPITESKKLRIGPRLMYTLPLMPHVGDPELRLNSFQILSGGRYVLD